MRNVLLAAAIFAASIGFAPAQAAPVPRDPGLSRPQEAPTVQDVHWRGRGWHRGWSRGHHYGWRHRHWRQRHDWRRRHWRRW